MICKDDLRYTDDVIATLQSDNPSWYIARALNIPVDDVGYHYEEVRDMTHHGAIMVIQSEELSDYPTDLAWYSSRSVKQIGIELSKPWREVKEHCIEHGIVTKGRGRPRVTADFPTSPEWYLQRTSQQAADELKISVKVLRQHVRENGYKVRVVRKHKWPRDVRWYEERTAAEIMEALNVPQGTVYEYLHKHGIRTKYDGYRITWPTEPEWFASRTIRQIADDLDINITSARTYVWRHKLAYRKVRSNEAQ
jgi:DNA-binding CsgD family transcriptional regulator